METASLVCLLFLISGLDAMTITMTGNWTPPITLPEERAESFTSAFVNITYVDAGGKIHWERTESGKYGDHHVFPVKGRVVRVKSMYSTSGEDPSTGCRSPLILLGANATDLSKGKEPWVALVKRGRCSFQTKMENAFYANASGVIIYNDKETPYLERMRLQSVVSKSRSFGAVFVAKEKGEELAKLVNSGMMVFVDVSFVDPSIKTKGNMPKSSVVFVSISFVILIIVSMGWIVIYYVQKCRYIHAKDQLSRRLNSAAQKALEKIPVKHISAEDAAHANDCCAVCIEYFVTDDFVRTLPCEHQFHQLCIDPWLLENRTCPMCKMDILKYFGYEVTCSRESILMIEQAENTLNELYYFNPDHRHEGPPAGNSIMEPIAVHLPQARNEDESQVNDTQIRAEYEPSTSAASSATVEPAVAAPRRPSVLSRMTQAMLDPRNLDLVYMDYLV